jgi:hypothetical protein
MKKFGEFIYEDLSGALVEPKSNSSQEAARLGLVYVGFGRYEDPKLGQITHIVQNDKLVPFNKAVKTNSFKSISSDDYGSYSNNLKPDIEQNHNDLVNHYAPENYDENELSAIESYTGEDYLDINEKLYSLPTGIPAKKIEPEFSDDDLPAKIAALDSALNKSVSPKEFLTYISLGSGYKLEDFKPGQVMRFKGYRSTTINPSIALNFGGQNPAQNRRAQTIIIQLLIKEGSKGMYVDDYSTTPGEGEFLLPRGTAVKLTSGPNKLVGSNGYTGELNREVIFFNAELVKNK